MAGHDGWECAFHSSDDDDCVCFTKLCDSAEQPLRASNTDINDQVDFAIHPANSFGGFFRDWKIARPRAHDSNMPAAFGIFRRNSKGAGRFVKDDFRKSQSSGGDLESIYSGSKT